MFEDQPMALRQRVADLASHAYQKGQPSEWFETLYCEANGDTTQIPWAKLSPHPYLLDWLTTHSIQGANQRALVIGCGLGDDAEILAEKGFQVTAFDIAPTAIAWCQQRFPQSTVEYAIADLFALPDHWLHAFDLVIEIRDIQALPLTVRAEAIQAVASTVASQGTLFIVTRVRETEEAPDGPPWPLSERELSQFQAQGLTERDRALYLVSDHPPVKQLRVIYK